MLIKKLKVTFFRRLLQIKNTSRVIYWENAEIMWTEINYPQQKFTERWR